jgi:ribose 5-phosphate isomerase B
MNLAFHKTGIKHGKYTTDGHAATARNSREHNYANVLTLGGKMLSAEQAREIVKTWLATPEGETRHGKRVAKIMAVEKQYLR